MALDPTIAPLASSAEVRLATEREAYLANLAISGLSENQGEQEVFDMADFEDLFEEDFYEDDSDDGGGDGDSDAGSTTADLIALAELIGERSLNPAPMLTAV